MNTHKSKLSHYDFASFGSKHKPLLIFAFLESILLRIRLIKEKSILSNYGSRKFDGANSVSKKKFKIVYIGDMSVMKLVNGKFKDIVFDSLADELKDQYSLSRYYLNIKKISGKNTGFPYNFTYERRASIPVNAKRCLPNVTKFFFRDLIENYQAILENEKPHLVLFFSESTLDARICIFLCKCLSIKTASLQHGIIDDKHPYYVETYPRNALVCPDYMFVYGAYVSCLLRKKGPFKLSKTEFIPTGSPKFKEMEHVTPKNIAELKRQYGLEESTKIITYLSNRIYGKRYRKYMMRVLKVLKNLEDNYLKIIKLHPNDEFVSEIVSACRKINLKNFRVMETEPLKDVLKISDIVLANYSTAIYEALVMKKQVIQIDFGKKFRLDLVNEKICLYATNERELYNSIHSIVSGKVKLKPQKYKEKYLKSGDPIINIATSVDDILSSVKH